ncbi:MAG: hypothetical protein ACTH0C_07675, partial [Actinomycetaceae bacterium]
RQVTGTATVLALALALGACAGDDDTDSPPATSDPAPTQEPEPEPPTDEAPTEEAPETPTEEDAEPPSDEVPSDEAPETPTEEDTGGGSADLPETDIPGAPELIDAVATVQDAYPDGIIISVAHADEAAEPTGPEGNGVTAEVIRGQEQLTVSLDPSGAIVDETTTQADDATLAAVDYAQLSIQDTINLAHDESLLGSDEYPLSAINLLPPQGPPEAEESPGTWWIMFYGVHDFVPTIDAATGEIFVPVG